jgi:hypothetical protein
MTWQVGYSPTGHTWRGFSKEDAYGAALAYIDTVRCGLHAAWQPGTLQQPAHVALPTS